MGEYEKLHLADNIDALDCLVKRNDHLKNAKNMNFEKFCSTLDLLYKTAQKEPLNQERKYILLVRYLLFYSEVLKIDRKFAEVRFGSEFKKVKAQFDEVKASLIRRYAESEVKRPKTPPSQPVASAETASSKIFDGEFIKCNHLFSALQSKRNILLVDARPLQDFKESRIDISNIINVPEDCITSGLSANALGKKLPPEVQKIWDKRDSYDALVLFDWNTTAETFLATKLDKLRSALVDWDLNRSYKEEPVVLDGGYTDFLEMYPTKCMNPQVYLQRRNYELDELLDIDNIIYPTETDNRSHVMGDVVLNLETSRDRVKAENESRDELVKENKKIAKNMQKVISKLLDEENAWKEVNEEVNKSTDNTNLDSLKAKETAIQEKISSLEQQLEEYNLKKDEVKKKFHLYAKFDPSRESFESEEIKEMINIELDESEKLKIIDAVSAERTRALEEARAVKPKTSATIPSTPAVNRATKPLPTPSMSSILSLPIDQAPERVGLKNIFNTCYMNTIVQCLRNVPSIMHLFCDGTYANFTIRSPAAVIYEMAFLVRRLWSKAVRAVEPREFYQKVCMLEPMYKNGQHEDCTEFFLFLLNHLSEDCSYDITAPTIMTPKQKAWYNQFQGKNSIFIDLFYHQIRISQTCPVCQQSSHKFEIESTFMLPVPDADFTLEEVMAEYMSDFIIPEYCCAKCKKPVVNRKTICHEPKIMVLILKRYKQVTNNGTISIQKITSRCSFPTSNFRLGSCKYYLNSIAMHSGNMNAGHYTAASLTSNGWLEFNDEVVRPININDDQVKTKATAFFYSICDDANM